MSDVRKPYVAATFDREEKEYFLKVALIIGLIYFLRDDIFKFLGLVTYFLPFVMFLYLYFKSLHTGERFSSLLREQITLSPMPYAEGGKEKFIPWASITLVVVNAAVFYATHALSPAAVRAIEESYMFLPVAKGDLNYLVSPLTSMFLHASAGHLWGNMAFLWAFAPSIEERLGAKKFVFLYLLTGLAGSLTIAVVQRLFFAQTVHGLGASGAVSGIMGIFMVRCYFKKLVVPVPVFFLVNFKLRINSLLVLGFFFLLDLGGGVSELAGVRSDTGYWAHIGSMAIGILLALLFGLQRAAAEEKHTATGMAAMKDLYLKRDGRGALQKALELNPDNRTALLGLAREAAATKKPEGRDLFAKAIRLELRSDPGQAAELYREYIHAYNRLLDPDLQYRLAAVLYRQGDLEAALRCLEMVVLEPSASDGTRQSAFSQLVIILAENKMDEAARFRLGQFREHFPVSPLLKSAEEKLAARATK